MAITRAQQAKQMLQDGGMLVKPSTDGKRPGYSNPNEDRAREERQATRSRDVQRGGAQFDAARRGESISPGTKGRPGPGPDKGPQTRDDNPLFTPPKEEQYEGTTQAGGTEFVTNLEERVKIPDKDQQKDLKKKLRQKNPNP